MSTAGTPRRALVVAGVLGLAACWAGTFAVRGLTGVPGLAIDAGWQRIAHGLRGHGTIAVSRALAELGAAPGSIVVTAAVAGLLQWRRGPRAAVALAVAVVADELLVTAMKLVDLRPGPTGAVFEGRGSFPSGHTAFAAVIAVVLVAVTRRPAARIAAVALIPVMGVSRTVVDAHWLTDTVAGAVCGTATAALVLAAVRPGGTGSPTTSRRWPRSAPAARRAPRRPRPADRG